MTTLVLLADSEAAGTDTGTDSNTDTDTDTDPDTTGGVEELRCIPDVDSIGVGGDDYNLIDYWSGTLNSTICVQGAPQWGTGSDNRIRTETLLSCEIEGDPTAPDFEVTVNGAYIDLGTDPVEVSFHDYLEEEHMFGSEAEYEFTVYRGETLLLLSDDGVGYLGATPVTGDVPCVHGDWGVVCGWALKGPGSTASRCGSSAARPRSSWSTASPGLVAARGVAPQTCPDGTEPRDPNREMVVNAIHSDLIVDR